MNEDLVEHQVRMRLKWIRLYEETGNASKVSRRCGISRPTLRKWYDRYRALGVEGLLDQSRRPHRSPNSKITPEIESLILNIRKKRKLGARRIQSELKRLYIYVVILGFCP